MKQKKFVEAYVENGGNGTQAALQVYDTEDYKTASVIATENLDDARISGAIASSWESTRNKFSDALTQAVAIAQQMLAGKAEEVRWSMNWLKEVAKALAPQSPKSISDNRKQILNLPSRTPKA